MSQTAALPERLLTLDVLRGFALCGVFLMNVPIMGAGFGFVHPPGEPSAHSADWLAYAFSFLFVEGAMRGLFCMLFGAGAILLTDRLAARHPDGSTRLYLRRQAILVGFGLVNGIVFLWAGDILFSYGLAGLIAVYWMRNASPRTLILIGIGLLFAVGLLFASKTFAVFELAGNQGPALLAPIASSFGAPLTESMQFSQTPAEFGLTSALIAEEAAVRPLGYVANLAVQPSVWIGFAHFQPFIIVEAIGTMALGMALMKLGIINGKASSRLYWTLVIVGYSVGIALRGLALDQAWRVGFGDEVWLTRVIYQPARIAMTLGHLGAIALLVRAFASSPAIGALAAFGRMALTNYLMQSVIALFVFTGAGLALFGQLGQAGMQGVALIALVVQIAFSLVWLRRFQQGPVERLWRQLAGSPAPRSAART